MTIEGFTREEFLACNWKFDSSKDDSYGYVSIAASLGNLATTKENDGLKHQSEILKLLGRAASMRLVAISLNEPFVAGFQDFQLGKRSAIPDDFSPDELNFFESILGDIFDPWLKARLADLLWICKRPRNPGHARAAIESYISHPINPESWISGVDDCWERGARLAIQLKINEKIEEIKSQLFSSFLMDHTDKTFMALWLAKLLDRLQVDRDIRGDIAKKLSNLGSDLAIKGDFNAARAYFEMAAKKNSQTGDEAAWISNLVAIAECFEKEADLRSSDSNLAANSFYENAIQAYRSVPIKHRAAFDIEGKMSSVKSKIKATGEATLDEMGVVKTPGVDISEIVKSSIGHVAGKINLQDALIHFVGLYSGPNHNKLMDSARETLKSSFFSSLFGSSRLSSDGRVVARVPAANLNAGEEAPENKAILHHQTVQHFDIEIQIVVKGQILPALRQVLLEHRVTKEFLELACLHSPIVPRDRSGLLSYALWLGFEYDFGNSIHLLCPQFEHIIRTQLKSAGAHTSNIDKDGIENENGLSTLMDLPEAIDIFGHDLVFEIRSVFTDSLGFNLRNEVAHGLLGDHNASSISSIYAWWMILRLIIKSIVIGSAFNKSQNKDNKNAGDNGA